MKRKKKDEEDGKEPKPKKYKKKIENPEKKRARYVYDNKANNGKVWEKNRRDRLNTTFDDLSLLLPQKDPPGKMSKVEILVAAIKEIGDLRQKLQELDQNVSHDKNEQIKVVPAIKDVACNTDIEEKENLPKPKTVHKKVQVNMLKKKKKKELPVESNELSVSSSETQTTEVAKSDANQSVETNKTSENNSLALVPFSASSQSVESVQTSSIATSHLSTTMRMTPALISTPIMTPNVFISNYPFVVSQIPQPVLIVNNKTEVNTTVNKVVTVASKSANGRVPLPPLKKTVAVKKIPRKKRILKKKVDAEIEKQNDTNGEDKNSKSVSMKNASEKEKDVMEKRVDKTSERASSNQKLENVHKENQPIANKPLEEMPLPITPLPIPSGKLIERLDSNSSLLNSQDTSNINDTSGISNLDIDNFSLLTANILSGIDANDTNLSSNLGKILDDKDLECNSKNSSLMNLPAEIASRDKSIEKSNVVVKPPETKPRETIQVRKGLLQSEQKLPNEQSSMERRAESMLIPITSSFDNNFNALSITSQANNYPNFALSLASQDKSRAKAISESVVSSTKLDTTYTMSGPSYSGNINYSGYYSNSNSSLQQLFNNQHPNNIISSSYSNNYESQRPYYADQPSTNFTFSLTSVAKSHAKYVSSGTKSQNMIPTQAPNIQEPCKKFTSKTLNSTYYSTENNTVKNVTSHSIARLNSKYDNHKENDTPFYLSQETPSCTKSNVVQKLTYNQPVFTNNSSCARYPQQSQQQLPSGSKQTTSNKSVKSSSISTSQQPQISSRYDVDWMSSSEIKPSTNDFQLFPTLESTTMNQNSYYSSNFDINRKTSDLYFAHPPGEENLPWSPSRMSMLDAQHLSGNQCYSSTLPNLHGELGLNTLSGGNSSRPSSIFETPTKSSSLSSYNASYSATKESKRISNNVESQQNNSFSVRQLVDINQSSSTNKSSVPTNDKYVKRKSSGRKEGEVDNFSSDIIPYENPKSNIYSAESLINPRHGSKNKSWHTESSHPMTSGESANQNNPLFSMEPTAENQYNYSTTRYDPKFFKQNYVTSFVDNSFSNNSQNYHNFSKSQPITFGETNNPSIDYHQSSLGNSMNSFLPHHEMPEKQHYYSHSQPSASTSSSSKSINPLSTNMDTISSRSNNQSTSHKKSSKSSSSHHVPSSTAHHSLIMNYDFPVPPVTPSLSYFSAHDWKSTPTEPYPTMHPNSCNTNSYVNSSYSQNILQNSQTQNLVTGLPSSNLNSNNNSGGNNNSHSQNTSNSLTNFNLSTICPEINDKVRQQNW